PCARCLVQLRYDVRVDRATGLEGAVELDLSDLAAQGRLRELRNRKTVVGDAVGRQMGVENLQVEHGVDADLDVVSGDANLLGDVDRLLLQVVPVSNAFHKGNQDMKPGLQRAAVPAETLHDVGALLGHHRRGFGDQNDDDEGDNDEYVRGNHEVCPS